MMKIKKVEQIFPPREAHFVGDGFRVHNFIPSVPELSMQRTSPFIMLDYNAPFVFPPSAQPKGVGAHPHRGFETVTIAYKGRVEHHDSNGGGGIIGEGDVQWMTAASGLLHKEFHERGWSKKGGEFQMVQLWINLPQKDKMSTPKYQAIKNENIPRVQLDDKGGEIEIIAGNYHGVLGSAKTFTPLHLYNIKIKKGGRVSFDFPAQYNTNLLVIEGNIMLNNENKIQPHHFVLMENEGESFSLQANEDAVVLLLSGEPINEPIAAYGPFVMNTKKEIEQAFDDFKDGKFGYLDN